MNHFMVNGEKREIPGKPSWPFSQLMEHLRSTVNTEMVLISAVRVNGVELTEENEKVFENLSLDELESVEILTSHPREMVEETLKLLKTFCDHLSRNCYQTAHAQDPASFHHGVAGLVDGLETFASTVSSVKSILRVGYLPAVNILEVDLISILEDVAYYYRTQDEAYVRKLLRGHLVENLQEWKETGIPALVRARDN